MPLRLDKTYKLDSRMYEILYPVFDTLGYDISDVVIRFGYTHGRPAFTVGDYVTLDEDAWAGMTSWERLGLLAHEITHSAQFEAYSDKAPGAGARLFMSRYISEYPKYGVPPSLHNIDITKLNVLDSRWSLDQIADRVGEFFLQTTNQQMKTY